MDSDLEDWSDFFTSDSSDEDYFDILNVPVTKKSGNFFEDTVSRYDEETFCEHFRVSRDVAMKIAECYQKSTYYKEDKQGQFGKISALHQVLIFLWFAGHQTSGFRMVSDRFKISQSSLHRVINRVTFFLSNLSPHVIKWPNEEDKKLSEAYFRSKGFPNVIGVIDGFHIKIDKPGNDPDSYLNIKGFYSVQMQAVCDHNHKIIDVFVGYPGSEANIHVFKKSRLFQSIQQKCGSYVLLGNSGYPLLRNLMTPFNDRGQLSRGQINYNVKHNENWRIIEQCFGMLRQKFRQLHHLKLRKITVIVHFIRACCVLHNIALEGNLIIDDDEPRTIGHLISTNDVENDEEENEIDARVVRDAIVDLLVV